MVVAIDVDEGSNVVPNGRVDARRVFRQIDYSLEVLLDCSVVGRMEEIIERWITWGFCGNQAGMRDCVGVLDCIEESICLIDVARGIRVAMIDVDGDQTMSLSLGVSRDIPNQGSPKHGRDGTPYT